ncbi:NAD(P)H-binding protein [Vibrio diazotrophicus]|uniref:NAD(P)H-binding protein n=1 Tax=Vibrio diazotrophicus TaxID=685 RepID=UPI00142DEABC|nr:NAD(P)H-binding protein [Vibrio diazotrophicus]NIY93522.1 NAD(P)H-binding protein [Vibrio diazotrophicus]
MKDAPFTATSKPVLIIAGASGLVGSSCLNIALNEHALEHIFTLSRKPLPPEILSAANGKLTQLIDAELSIKHWEERDTRPQLGIIALGTTLKQAGSKQGLEKVDFELVSHVAQQMKLLGVERLAVVSSYGAHARSRSHYLRCKGRMEETIRQIGFTHVTFVRPGPLVGKRAITRPDEVLLQNFMRVGKYLLFGKLRNLIPITAEVVARSMLYSLFDTESKHVSVLDSISMHHLLEKYG